MDLREYNFNELIKISVEQGGLAQFVYKYRDLNPNTDKIFETSKLWFSNPSDFNDPFDCQVIVDTKNSEDEIANFLKQNALGMSSVDVKKFSRLWSKNPTEWNKIVSNKIHKSANEKGVCTFASNNNNILIWSHYTNSHKGICLKFDILADTNFFSVPFHVQYSKDYPYYNHLKDNSQLVKYLMQTKADIWQYEGEVRVVKLTAGAYEFKKESLKEICFGCNCTKDDIDRVKSSVNTNNFNVVFTKAAKAATQFSLNIKRL
jgi:hypothetical protein